MPVTSRRVFGSGEEIDDLALCGVVRHEGTGAGVLLPLARGHEAHEKAPRRILLLARQPVVGGLSGVLNRRVDAPHGGIGVARETVALPLFPYPLQRELKQRQPAFLRADIVENLRDQVRRIEGQSGLL